MNHFKKTTLMIGLTVSMTGIVHAQSDTDIDQLRAEVKELRDLIKQYTQTQQQQSQHIQQVQTQVSNAAIAQPNQTKTHKPNGLALTVAGSEVKLYGNVRMDAQYQAEGGAAARLYNQISSVPLQGVNERSDEFKSTLSATRLGLDFKTPTQGKEVIGKLEVDFLGGANFDNLRIRHAYVNYGNWLLGQTWSNFAVPDYMPESVDALGFVGGAVKRTPQVRYSHSFNPETHLISSIEDPKDTSISTRMPAFTTRLNHKVTDTLALSGRVMAHEKRIDQDEKWAWGVGLGAKYDLLPKTSIKADYYHVKGDSSFVSWANTGVLARNNEIVAQNKFDSITVGVTQQFNDKLRGTLGYGFMKFDQDSDYINASVNQTAINKELWQAWANMFYSPTKPISLGVEYVYGEREAFGAAPNASTKGEDNRVNAVAIYNF
ncbi:hypothetical protein AMD27_07890 [Acinetobacter sp. TGL-Y2]|uniref:DcaP family trimeric outer membrane transporter n=1 Tax=Acinetobacter sp. TGL-Y2 TaxID=1407071 RepID=UPI0007A6551A|nr:DcaP family trimeric outer membrane transporter [Acinetobacter sp. TGL-Y2]AMW78807.1 hypothetical protein AMD27_07890 [Acinetobacter sp. TGL-Y2]